MALLSRWFGGAAASGAGFAMGRATAPVLAPPLEQLRQEAWKLYAIRVPDVAALAAGVAQGKVARAGAEDWASTHGFGKDAFGALVNIATEAPDVGLAMRAWRRGALTNGQFETVLKRAGLDERWTDAIEALKRELLTPGELAAAIHRGLIPDPGLLRGEQPEPPFKVEAYPVYNIDAEDEAAGSGFDRNRLGVLVGLQGLPMGVIEAAHAYYRKIITRGDYIRAFNESNNRNEWAAAVLEYARQIPTARDFMENALRGHHDFEWAAEQAARHGMTKDDAFLIYQNQGRALNLHQITQALAWGGKYQPGQGDNPDPWVQAVLLGAVRPEYYDLQESLKYNLPSAFYFRALQEQGVLSETEAVTWYKRLGWPPDLAEKVAHAYAGGGDTKADAHVGKAQTQLWGTTHRSFLAAEITETQARNALGKAGVASAAVPDVIATWTAERELIRKQLTPAQIKRAFLKASKNYATGQPWTRDDALAALLARGYSVTDANDFLDIPSGSK